MTILIVFSAPSFDLGALGVILYNEILICKIEFHIVMGFFGKYLRRNPTLYEEGFHIYIPLSLRILQIRHKSEASSSASQLALESLPSERGQLFHFPRFCKYAMALQNCVLRSYQ